MTKTQRLKKKTNRHQRRPSSNIAFILTIIGLFILYINFQGRHWCSNASLTTLNELFPRRNEKTRSLFFIVEIAFLLPRNPSRLNLPRLHRIPVLDEVLDETIEWEKDEKRHSFTCSPLAYTLAQCRAVFSNNFRSFLYWFATTETGTCSESERDVIAIRSKRFYPHLEDHRVQALLIRLEDWAEQFEESSRQPWNRSRNTDVLIRSLIRTRRTIDLWEYRGK